jgi:hypothetical protein
MTFFRLLRGSGVSVPEHCVVTQSRMSVKLLGQTCAGAR